MSYCISNNSYLILSEGICEKEYECKLNEETQEYGWFNLDNLPKPLFPTLYSSLVRIF